MVKYSELLQRPEWQKKRLQIMERDNWKCLFCGDDNNNLQVHHVTYHKGLMPWQYPDDVYKTLCRTCHESETRLRSAIDSYLVHAFRLSNLSSFQIRQLMDIAMDNPDKIKSILTK